MKCIILHNIKIYRNAQTYTYTDRWKCVWLSICIRITHVEMAFLILSVSLII